MQEGEVSMKLLEPISVKGISFQNRIAIAPMCPFGVRAGEEESLGEEILEYYRKRLATKPGLLITQAFKVKEDKSVLRGFGIFTPKQLTDLKKLADIAHENGTKIIVQLAYPSDGHHRHDTIDFWRKDELKKIEDSFVKAAFNAKEAGCDGVELHGANMFFLNLFSSPITNHRIDEFGGDVNGRLHLAANIIGRIKEFAGDDFIIDYRMGWNQDLETDIETAKALEKLGIDLFHISYGIRESDRYMPKEYPSFVSYPGTTRQKQIGPADFDYNDVVYTGAQIKKHLGIPVILVDEIWTFERGEKLLQENAGDFIAYGRPFLADDQFAAKSRDNPSFDGCCKCKDCAWFYDCYQCPRVKQRGYV
jgi:2,4-dienoyl-CoA reductase-like NADH-dependent reductase (Old Yellow Enzyme family)